MSKVIRGKAFVVRDNIDTDQIIPAQYLNLVPTIPEEYEKLGSFALCGLPKDQYPTRFIPEGQTRTPYTIVIGGAILAVAVRANTRQLRSARRGAKRWWRKVLRAFSSVTAWRRVNFTRW